MFDVRRPTGWLFYLASAILLLPLWSAAQGPALTTISDTVYRADGLPANGTLLISWPAFSTANGLAVAAGVNSALLGAGGALSAQLAPNVGASPAGTVYTVVYQLTDGEVKTEYWTVPTTSPTTIAAMRTILGASSSVSQMATQQFVNAALASKADEAAVVHIGRTETITGLKQFSLSPRVPTPQSTTDSANKAYVDGGLAGKAYLVNGLVAPVELGSGSANNSVCLHGDSTWGGCGTSTNATQIQNVPVDTTAPTDNQVIAYVASLGKYTPRGVGGVSAGMQAVKYAIDFNWSFASTADLSSAGAKTVNFASCPAGVTGTEPQYYIYISGTGTAEAVLVTGGTCAGNGQAGTLQFTTISAHPAGYTLASASGGLQEALVAARFVPTNPTGSSQSGKVIVSPGELKAYARVSIRASNMTVDFSGSIVECWMNDTCIYIGDTVSSNAFGDITLISPRGRPTITNGQKPFIEVNAQKTRIFNVSTRAAFSNGTFGSYVQVDDDQASLDQIAFCLSVGISLMWDSKQ